MNVADMTVGELLARLEKDLETMNNVVTILRAFSTAGTRPTPVVPGAPDRTAAVVSPPPGPPKVLSPPQANGRPSYSRARISDEKRAEAQKAYENHDTVVSIATRLGVSTAAVYGWISAGHWKRAAVPDVPKAAERPFIRNTGPRHCKCGAIMTTEPCSRCGYRTLPA